MSTDRLVEIETLLAVARKRMSVERAFALLRAVEDLLRVVPRQSRLL